MDWKGLIVCSCPHLSPLYVRTYVKFTSLSSCPSTHTGSSWSPGCTWESRTSRIGWTERTNRKRRATGCQGTKSKSSCLLRIRYDVPSLSKSFPSVVKFQICSPLDGEVREGRADVISVCVAHSLLTLSVQRV